jgi:hypothetical protein
VNIFYGLATGVAFGLMIDYPMYSSGILVLSFIGCYINSDD